MEKEELIKKYGELELKFNSYYKFVFTYKADKDGLTFIGSYGGNSDDIYKENITPESVVKIKDYKNLLTYLIIKNGNDILFKYIDIN